MHLQQLQPQLHSRNHHQHLQCCARQQTRPCARSNLYPGALSLRALQGPGTACGSSLLHSSLPGCSATHDAVAATLSTSSYSACVTLHKRPRTSAVAAAAATAAAPAADTDGRSSGSGTTTAAAGVRAAAQQKSLEVLEWRSVCRQVRRSYCIAL